MDSLLIEDHGMLIRSIDQSLTVSEVGMVHDCHTVMMIAKSDFRIVCFGVGMDYMVEFEMYK